eukprot:9098480-Pyramimonas_sp.AAC.1
MRSLLVPGLRLALRTTGWPMTTSASCDRPARALFFIRGFECEAFDGDRGHYASAACPAASRRVKEWG